MSRARLISLISGIFIGWLYKTSIKKNKKREDIYKITNRDIFKGIVVIVGIFLSGIILLKCLIFISRFMPQLEFLHVGIIDSEGRMNLIRKEAVDIDFILSGIFQQPYGYGFSNALHTSTTILDTNLANALIFWLVISSILGAIISLLLMIFLAVNYCIPYLKSEDNIKRSLGKIFISLLIHSLSYGTWMTQEIILVVCLMILVKYKKIGND